MARQNVMSVKFPFKTVSNVNKTKFLTRTIIRLNTL